MKKDYSEAMEGIGRAFGAWLLERALRPFIGREITYETRAEMIKAVRPLIDDLLLDRVSLALRIDRASGRAQRVDRNGLLVEENERGVFVIIPGNMYTALLAWGVVTTTDVPDSLTEIQSYPDGVETWFRWKTGDIAAEVTVGSGSDAKTEKFYLDMGYDEKTKRLEWMRELIDAGCTS